MNERIPKLLYAGLFHYKVDSKQRLSIPARWLIPGLEPVYYLAWRVEKTLRIYPEAHLDRFLEKSKLESEGNLELKRHQRHLFSHAHMLVPDAQKRIRLDAALLAELEISDAVVLAGEGLSFSICSEAVYAAEDADVFEFSEAADALAPP
jgi:DNA-binding transcriptional regulator/RsmH inhibitor MraZ